MPKKDGTPTVAEKRKAIAAKDAAYKARKKAQGRKLDSSGRTLVKVPFRDAPMKQFAEEISGQEAEMGEALKATGNAKMMALYTEIVTNPRNSLALSCRRCNVSLQELQDMWSKHQLSRGLIRVSNQLPEILEDTATDARSRFEVCDRCDGAGEITRFRGEESITETCPKCKGAREVRVAGDAESRKQIFEMTGLTGKSGPLVAIQQNTFVGETLDDTLSAAQKILTGQVSQDVIDVEATDETPDTNN